MKSAHRGRHLFFASLALPITLSYRILPWPKGNHSRLPSQLTRLQLQLQERKAS